MKSHLHLFCSLLGRMKSHRSLGLGLFPGFLCPPSYSPCTHKVAITRLVFDVIGRRAKFFRSFSKICLTIKFYFKFSGKEFYV